jgi:guanylate kinase
VLQALHQGNDVVLEIDVQGAGWVRQRVPEAVLIFLEPPTLEELARRLRSRHTESERAIARRLAAAEEEMAARDSFDHIVVNGEVDRAAAQVAAIIADESGTAGAAR